MIGPTTQAGVEWVKFVADKTWEDLYIFRYLDQTI